MADQGPKDPERRQFLSWTWKALAVGLAVDAGWTTYDILVPREAGGFGGMIEAGSENAFPEGEVRYFGEGRFYVTRVQDELLALWQKCPHLGCRVPFCDSSGRFECPCHGSVFNRKGEYLAGPAPRGMDRFPIQVEDGTVHVDTGTVIEGSGIEVRTFQDEPAGPSCLEQTGQPEPPHVEEPHEEEDEHGQEEGS